MTKTAQERRQAAQDAIIAACVMIAFKADDDGDAELAIDIRKEASRLAKRYGISEVPGLPDTYPPSTARKLRA
jgi:hypothetical protein